MEEEIRNPLHVQLFGSFHLQYQDKSISSINSARLQSLLAFLVLNQSALQSRQYLAFLLWPESEEGQARTNLRKLIYQLRRELPDSDHFLHYDTNTIGLNRDARIISDVDELRHLLQRHKADPLNLDILQAIADRYKGELLPSCYDDWILPLREELHESVKKALAMLVTLLQNQRQYDEAARQARRLLTLDPLAEEAHRQLMRSYALASDRASALRIYQECVAMLAREFGVEPETETQHLYDAILNNAIAPPLADGPTSSAARRISLVGRHAEWQMLQQVWRRALQGDPQLILITGIGGIGKTRLAEELLDLVIHQGALAARSRSYAIKGAPAYAPVTTLLRTPALSKFVDGLDAMWQTELLRLLPELRTKHPELPKPSPMTEDWQRIQFIEALCHVVLDVGQPLLLLLDDLQWSDADTLAWLHHLLRHPLAKRLLIVGTVRDDEVEARHPLLAVQRQLQRDALVTAIPLSPLNQTETADLMSQVAGGTVSVEQQEQFFQDTVGNPLFVVEMARAAVDEAAIPGTVTQQTILPEKIYAVIQSRLALLSPEARVVANIASVIGNSFDYSLLNAACAVSEEALVDCLDELLARSIIQEQDTGTYDFSHDRIRDVVYTEISRTRRRLLHRNVAQSLEAIHVTDIEAISKQLAVHYGSAGLHDRAATYYNRAAEASYRLYAFTDTEFLLEKGLEANRALPRMTPAAQQCEMHMQTLLGKVLVVSEGFTSHRSGQAFHKALELCKQLDLTEHFPEIINGLRRYYHMRGERQTAQEYANQLLAFANQQKDDALLAIAHYAMGTTLHSPAAIGEPAKARIHFEKALSFYKEQNSRQLVSTFIHDPRVDSLRYLAQVLWDLGYPDQAVTTVDEAVDYAQTLHHPPTLIAAISIRAAIHFLRREYDKAQCLFREALDFTVEHRLQLWMPWLNAYSGCALAAQGKLQEGISKMEQGIDAFQQLGGSLGVETWSALLGHAYIRSGQLDRGLRKLEEVQSWIHRKKGQSITTQASLIIGDGLRLASMHDKAEPIYHDVLAICRQYQLRSWELRAALHLAQLWQSQGRHQDARELLSPLYNWFNEGLDTPDLVQTKKLIDEVS